MSERAPAPPHVKTNSASTSLAELAVLFLRLGATAFGGPAAHIAMMEQEVVRRRGWLTHQQFLDMIGATNLIPGPNSTEMAIHVGYQRAGLGGLIVAGASFILPATLIVGVIAWAYVRFESLPAMGGVLYGVKPVVIAVVAQALWNLGKSAVKNKTLAVVGVLTALCSFLGVNELLVLFGAAALAAISESILDRADRSGRLLAVLPPALWLPSLSGVAAAATASASAGLWPLFLVFLKIGSVLFGSGYVLLAFLRADFVERFGWLTEAQLIDAVAVGQITPGPVFTTATFIGYVLAGPSGAAVATVGIFLPAFFFVAVSAPFLARLRNSRWAGKLLDGLNVASLALMAVVTIELVRSALVDVATLLIGAASAVALLRTRVNSAWLVAAGAGLGWLITK